ncbi:hypothetical protein ACPPVS_15660 [Cellulomonas sp. McL0617]|uniref:hypothetical protein n=1 Tax=Cellulomonas sp. McL0617 TaxID=3415675 RepID=UPI003CF5D0D3
MSSSSNEPRPFLSRDRGSILRLVVVVLFGVAALVGPVLASTASRFSDEKQIGVQLSVPGTPTPTPTPTP